jgi:hypothetical protein
VTTQQRRPTGTVRPALTEASMARVFDALQALAVKFGSVAEAARVVGCTREAARLILNGGGVSPGLAKRILAAAGVSATVDRRPTALERLRAGRETHRPRRRDLLRAERVKQLRVERADAERRVATVTQRSAARSALGPLVSRQSALDTLAALVAALLVEITADPVGELDPSRDGFTRRVERHVLAALLDIYDTPNAVAMVTRGRPVGASLQRNFARHRGDLGSLSDDMAREVRALLKGKRGAWEALLAALKENAARAAE